MTLQKLQTLRDGSKRVVQRYLENLENTSSLTEFIATLEALEKKVEQISSFNAEILQKIETDAIEEEMLSNDTFMLEMDIKIRDLRTELRRKTNRSTNTTQTHQVEVPSPSPFSREPIHESSAHNNQNNSQTLSATSYTSNTSQYHRLPKLTLPTFNGDIFLWQTFWDSFESTVHLNVNLTDVQKFSYLRSLLECDAARTIDGFKLTNANYARAVDLLKERFGQQHKLTHATMQALLQLPAPRDNLESIRNFYDKMETHIRTLESIGQHPDTFGGLLVPVVLDKLPPETRRNLAREHGNSSWSLCDLRRAIYRELNILEAGSTSRPEVDMYQSTVSFLAGTRHTPEVRHIVNMTSPAKKTVSCQFCNGDHGPNDCTEISTVEQRLSIVKHQRLCYNCLGKHQVLQCRSRARCMKCHRKHHMSICSASNYSQPSSSSTQEERPEATTLHSTTPAQNNVLLKTAILSVETGNTKFCAGILFDEGSQQSYITQELAESLQLPVDGT